MPSQSLANRWLCASLCGVALALAACAVTQPGANNRFAVKTDKTQFYKYGPAQSYGADAVLARDEKLMMLKKDFGFSQVRRENGDTGYVATEDLVQLPPEPKPAPARLASRFHPKPEPERKLDLTDIPLPAP